MPNGMVILYADTVTGSMRYTMDETNRRPGHPGPLQPGARHHPAPSAPRIKDGHDRAPQGHRLVPGVGQRKPSRRSRSPPITRWKICARKCGSWRREMHQAAEALEFEEAARYRDRIKELKLLG